PPLICAREDPMGTGRVGLPACGLGLIALGSFRAAARAADAREPAYRGKPVSAWVAGLKDEDAGGRRAAAKALARVGPGAKPAVGPLMRALADDDWQVRGAAAMGLGGIGPGAKRAIPLLMQTLKDPSEGVRAYASNALAKVGKDAVPPLIGALRDD